MKIRYGFVTNSSSSSFVLAFKDEEDFSKFEEWCDDLYYNEMKELIMHFMENEERTLDEQKKEAIEFVKFAMTVDDLRDWEDQKVKEKYGSEYWKFGQERYDFVRELEKTQEYLDLKETLLKSEEIQKRIKRIQEAEKLCQGTIWDTSGGTLEWAIRNGFLQSEFWDWTIYVQNIG